MFGSVPEGLRPFRDQNDDVIHGYKYKYEVRISQSTNELIQRISSYDPPG